MKNKPFLNAAIVFGCIGLFLLFVSALIFLTKNTSLCTNLEKLLGTSITSSTIAELAAVFFMPAFVFAYKSFTSEE